ncbi:hypothetical protein Ahy_A03g013601 [Arachis hypogaea]|uniref:F-box associated domain-containing protein n=1 Tax=Arachis hypogaea TaxID=3818 RepID=A0A445DVS5_ARAHY|nr:hypothetical protein Ahy_A03g013601 [Arachis hypogaea]
MARIILSNNFTDNSWETIVEVYRFGESSWRNIDMIFSLELKSETYKQILLPNGIDELPSQKPSLNKTHFIVWQMKEFRDENSWTQLLKNSFQHINVELLLPFVYT